MINERPQQRQAENNKLSRDESPSRSVLCGFKFVILAHIPESDKISFIAPIQQSGGSAT